MIIQTDGLQKLPVLDASVIDSLREIMEDDFHDLLETYLGDAVLRMRAIEEAARREDADALRKAAHSFKGSSGNIGARQLSELCRQVEEAAAQGKCPEVDAFFGVVQEAYGHVVQQIQVLMP